MVRVIFNYCLVKFKKNHVVSKEITNKQILETLFSRMRLLVRVKLRNEKNTKLVKASTIQERVHVDGYAKQKVSYGNRVKSEGIEARNNIWVGAKATFLDACKVSDNSIVASGAVVTDKFSSGVVIGGVPARVIKEL